MPGIRAAKEWGRRPTAVLTRDEHFGHRHPLTGRPLGDSSEWLEIDYALVYALQVIEDYTDRYGLLAWELDDDAVVVDAVKKVHKFEQAKDEITNSKKYKKANGEYFVPDLYTRRADGHIQTYQEWIRAQVENQFGIE